MGKSMSFYPVGEDTHTFVGMAPGNDALVLLALESAEITETEACQLLNLCRVSLRQYRDEQLEYVMDYVQQHMRQKKEEGRGNA